MNETTEIKKSFVFSKKLLLIPVFLLLLAIGLNSFYTLRQSEYAYVTRFSKLVTLENEPGLKVKIPFVDQVSYIPAYNMLYDIPPSEVITADKKTLVVDNFVVWRVTDPFKFIQTLRGSVSEMEARISASVYSEVKNEFGRLLREQIISTDPSSVEKVSTAVTNSVNESLDAYGITVTTVEIKKTDLPEDNAQSVYDRMIAERNKIAAAYLADGELAASKIRNDVNKQIEVILSEAEANAEKRKGEAEAQYMEILADAYSTPEKAEFYRFLRSLDALQEAFAKGETTLILDEDSEIVRVLLGK